MEVSIPTHKEIYMISYLTIHGWEPDYDVVNWTKKGFERKMYNYYGDELTTEKFSLEDAYWAQMEEDNSTKENITC